MKIEVINAIVAAAEREGGVHMLSMPGKYKTWHKCCQLGYLWYNNRVTNGTHVIKL